MGIATTPAVTDDEATRMAPCLGGGPLASPARALVNAAGELGSAPWASLVRASCVLYLFDAMEHAFASDREPTAAIQAALGRMSGLVHAAVATGFAKLGGSREVERCDELGVEATTGEHYGRLFQPFSDASFWDEPRQLLQTRLERNDIDSARFRGKRVL